MSADGRFWQVKKGQKAQRELEARVAQARQLLTQALALLGGDAPVEEGSELKSALSGLIPSLPPKPHPPPAVGYMECEGCRKHRRCFLVDSKKLCMTCRRDLRK